MKNIRLLRISKTYKQILGEILMTEVQNPILNSITLHEVDISPDLRTAKVYYSFLESSGYSLKQIKNALHKSRGYLKKELGSRISLKYTPDLVFYYDKSLDELNRLEEIFHKLDQEKSHSQPSSSVSEDMYDEDID